MNEQQIDDGAVPLKLEKWLLHSIGWTVAGVGIWVLIVKSLEVDYDGLPGFVVSGIVQLLLWKLASPNGRASLGSVSDSWLKVVGWVWWCLLHMALIMMLVMTLYWPLNFLLVVLNSEGPLLDIH